jgi:TRAP-type transport system periplasmic protein
MGRVIRTLAACALLVGGFGGIGQAQDKVVVKVGHMLPPDSHYQQTSHEFARLVAQKSNGKIEVQVFAQSQLGNEIQMIQALRTGTQDMVITAQPPVVNTIKQWEIFDIPYLFDSLEEANRVMQGPVGRKYLDMLPQANMIGLAWMSCLEHNLFTMKKTVRSLEDMKQLKVRVLQSPGVIAGYKSLGANPTPIAYNQLFIASSQGVIDAATMSPDQFVQDKFVDIAKHYYLTHVNYMPIVLAIGKPSWSKLTPEQQKIVQEAAAEAALRDVREYYPQQYESGMNEIRKAGIDVQPVDTKQWAAATIPARDEILARIPDGQALFKEIQAARTSKQ